MRYNIAEIGTNKIIHRAFENCAPLVGDYYVHDNIIYIVRKRVWHSDGAVTCVVEKTEL